MVDAATSPTTLSSAAPEQGCAQLFNRVLLDAFLYKKMEISSNWRQEPKTSGYLITDAKGLRDHLHKTAGVASPRALDMMLMKQMIAEAIVRLNWTPARKQLADPSPQILLRDPKERGEAVPHPSDA